MGREAAFVWFHHVSLFKKKENPGQDVNLNMFCIPVITCYFRSVTQLSVDSLSLTALSVPKLTVSLLLKRPRHSNPNKKKTECNKSSKQTVLTGGRFWSFTLVFFHRVCERASPSVPASHQLSLFFRMSLSSLLMILSTLPESLFICGMFQTGGFERSTTFWVFCWPCLHLFWNVLQPINSEVTLSELLSGWRQIRYKNRTNVF